MLAKVDQYCNLVSLGLRVDENFYVSVCDAHCNPVSVEDPAPFLISIARDIYVDVNFNLYLEGCHGDVYRTLSDKLISLGKKSFDLYQNRIVRVEEYPDDILPVVRDSYGKITGFAFYHANDVVYRPDGKVTNIGLALIRYRSDGKIDSICGRRVSYYSNGQVESIGNTIIRRDSYGRIYLVGNSQITRNSYGAPTKVGLATIDYTNGKVSRLDSWKLHLDQYGFIDKIGY